MHKITFSIKDEARIAVFKGARFLGWLIFTGEAWEARPVKWKTVQYRNINKAKRYFLEYAKYKPFQK